MSEEEKRETREVNIKDDFDFILKLYDLAGNEIGFPDYDFRGRLRTSGYGYYDFSCVGGVMSNVRDDNGQVHVYYDNDGSLGAGDLTVEFISLLPDGEYSDGSKRVATMGGTGIRIVKGATEPPSAMEVETTLNHIKGEPFTYDDFTSGQLADLRKPAEEAATRANVMMEEFAQAEQTREGNEDSRQENERGRAANESERAEAESSRGQAESERVSAEDSRAVAEDARVKAEQTREGNEDSRQENEQERQSGEKTRQKNELERAENEKTRQKNELERAENEKTRMESEDSRLENESERLQAESEREASEAARATAEQLRAEAENGRAESEGQRRNGEDSRVAAERQRALNEAEREERSLYGAYSVDFGAEAATANVFNAEGTEIEITRVDSVNVAELTLACGNGEPTAQAVGSVVPAGGVAVWSVTRSAEGVEAAIGVRFKRKND